METSKGSVPRLDLEAVIIRIRPNGALQIGAPLKPQTPEQEARNAVVRNAEWAAKASGATPKLAFHAIADIFPLLEGAALNELANDIAQHGVRTPIMLYEGAILDGRNRWRAAEKVHAHCPRVEYTGDDPVGMVVSLNLKRRHLTTSQRAMVAANIANLGEGRHLTASIEAVSQNAAATALKVSRSAVQRAAVVREHGTPELQAKVVAGEISVSAAAAEAKPPKKQSARRKKSFTTTAAFEEATGTTVAEVEEAERQTKDERNAAFQEKLILIGQPALVEKLDLQEAEIARLEKLNADLHLRVTALNEEASSLKWQLKKCRERGRQ